MDKNNILVIAPHPDDEVLGCGGTIALHSKKGDQIYLVIVTKGYTPDWSEEQINYRPTEVKKATKILGIKETFFLDYPTVKLDTFPQKELNDKLFEIISKRLPDTVYIPHAGDLNKDHRLIHEAALVATRPLSHKVKRILSYETLSETEWGRSIKPFIPNVYVDISKTFEIKIDAFKAYEKSELKQPPHPRSIEIIEALAKKRGSEITVKYAEAFHLIREII
ncbi:MAG: PIG-L deacetylase family protein [Candidatus Helarchaeota archaeon]